MTNEHYASIARAVLAMTTLSNRDNWKRGQPRQSPESAEDQIFDAIDDLARILRDRSINEKSTCTHQYSRAMHQPVPRLCTLCGQPEVHNMI